MGAASTLQYALRSRLACCPATLVGIGSGSTNAETFRANAEANAKLLESGGMAALLGR